MESKVVTIKKSIVSLAKQELTLANQTRNPDDRKFYSADAESLIKSIRGNSENLKSLKQLEMHYSKSVLNSRSPQDREFYSKKLGEIREKIGSFSDERLLTETLMP